MPTHRLKCLLLAAGGLLAAVPLAAQEPVVIYRCTAADGSVIIQNDRPCPSGTTQRDRRVVQPAPTAPVPPPAVAAPDPGLPVPAGGSSLIEVGPNPTGRLPVPAQGPGLPATGPATLPVPRATDVPAPTSLAVPPLASPTDEPPPPPLYECRTVDGATYLSEVPNPAPRCAALRATGLGGVGTPAGTACEMVSDRCEAVPAPVLCERWRQRLEQMDRALTFGRLDERETATVEIDRIRSIVEDSTCGL